MQKILFFIDGAFFTKLYQQQEGRFPMPENVKQKVETLVSRIQSSYPQSELFRVNYYDCAPFDGCLTAPDGEQINYGETVLYQKKMDYLNALAEMDQFQVCLGRIAFKSWSVDPDDTKSYKPNFQQKGVDVKIGLDMAAMAMKKVADKFVLITADADFLDPIKFVRQEGIQVYLCPLNNPISGELRRNCDFVL